jgi:hypothetical protein
MKERKVKTRVRTEEREEVKAGIRVEVRADMVTDQWNLAEGPAHQMPTATFKATKSVLRGPRYLSQKG